MTELNESKQKWVPITIGSTDSDRLCISLFSDSKSGLAYQYGVLLSLRELGLLRHVKVLCAAGLSNILLGFLATAYKILTERVTIKNAQHKFESKDLKQVAWMLLTTKPQSTSDWLHAYVGGPLKAFLGSPHAAECIANRIWNLRQWTKPWTEELANVMKDSVLATVRMTDVHLTSDATDAQTRLGNTEPVFAFCGVTTTGRENTCAFTNDPHDLHLIFQDGQRIRRYMDKDPTILDIVLATATQNTQLGAKNSIEFDPLPMDVLNYHYNRHIFRHVSHPADLKAQSKCLLVLDGCVTNMPYATKLLSNNLDHLGTPPDENHQHIRLMHSGLLFLVEFRSRNPRMSDLMHESTPEWAELPPVCVGHFVNWGRCSTLHRLYKESDNMQVQWMDHSYRDPLGFRECFGIQPKLLTTLPAIHESSDEKASQWSLSDQSIHESESGAEAEEDALL